MLPKDWDTVNSYDADFVRAIESSLEEAIARSQAPYLAAFDADGTLWDTDIGETFFKYQIKNCTLRGLPKDAWEEYGRRKAVDYAKGCLWLAQLNQGVALEQVRTWSRQCLKAHAPLPVFENIKRLVSFLHGHKFEVYVVSASIKWAVEPAAELLGIPEHRVIGMETRVVDGIISDIAVEPLPWGPGKSRALLHRTKGIQPIIAAGNTGGDLSLLECATDIHIATRSARAGEELYESEQKLQVAAKKNGWLTYEYRK